MAAIYSRIFIFYNLIYTIFLCILPKKLKQHFPIPKSHNQKPPNDIVSQIQTPHPSRMNSEELQITFQMFDKNGDGRITKQELNDSLQKMAIFITDEDLVQMIEKIDVNGDGCVDLGEFGELYETIMDDREDEEDMMDAFNVFDQNRDGFIAVEELRSVLETLGIGKQGRESDDCRRMIMKVDRDGDGMVSFSEFKQMMRSGGFAQIEQN